MSDPILDPVKLADVLKNSGIIATIENALHGLVAAAPLDDEQKAVLEATIDTKVNAIVNQFGPEFLAAFKMQVIKDAIAALTTGKSVVTDDQSALA